MFFNAFGMVFDVFGMVLEGLNVFEGWEGWLFFGGGGGGGDGNYSRKMT